MTVLYHSLIRADFTECAPTLLSKVLFMLSFEEQANTGMLQGT